MPARKQTSKTSIISGARRGEAGKRLVDVPVLDPIITMNAGGVIQSASDSVEQMFGWTPNELYGQNVKVLIPEPKRSSLDRYLDRYRNASKAKLLTRSRVFDAVRKDGKLIQIELSMSRADLPANAPAYFIGIIRNVSDEIPVAADGDERTRMHRLITDQTRALATANLRLHLADRLSAIGTLAAGLGHDMNSVLLPVRARLNAMEHSGVSAAAMEHLTAIRRSITYLQQLSDGLHYLTVDPESNRGTSQSESTTNIARWWKEMGTLLRKTLPSKVQFSAMLPPSLPDVEISPYLLTQAVLNLLVNAGESFTPEYRNGKVRVWAKLSQEGKSLRLGVSDNGRGMAPGVKRRAFDLFYTTKVRGIGTGLGLPLVRKVAANAGGDVELQSTLGKGTSAVLVLPTVKGSGSKSVKAKSQRLSAVLSVQDHRASGLISQILLAAGVELKTAKDSSPGRPDIWVTQPTAGALASAGRLRQTRSKTAVVLVGAPPRNTRKKWEACGPVVIDKASDFEAIRHILGQTLSAQSGNVQRGVET